MHTGVSYVEIIVEDKEWKHWQAEYSFVLNRKQKKEHDRQYNTITEQYNTIQ